MIVHDFMWMLSGANVSQSLGNLQQWLDNLVITVCPNAIALDKDGQRLPGIFHQMQENEADDFMSL